MIMTRDRYAAMAYAARVSGNKVKSNAYISQARLLCSSVYDQPDIDTGNIPSKVWIITFENSKIRTRKSKLVKIETKLFFGSN